MIDLLEKILEADELFKPYSEDEFIATLDTMRSFEIATI